MSNDAILIPGEDDEVCDIPQETTPQEYLTIEGSLKEIADSNKLALARHNLEVYSKLEIDDFKEEISSLINTHIELTKAITDKFEQDLDNISQTQGEFVKKDGSTPFESIQEGVTPSDNNERALATVKYILEKLSSYYTISDTDKNLLEKLAILEKYALLSDVYKKSNTYCKALIDNLLESYVSTDGGTPFKNPLEGQYPKLRTHLSTKGYVDDTIKQHKNELDPHNFQAVLNLKLNNYYKKSETYTKAQTYSRLQLDLIIDLLVSDACKSLIEKHLNTTLHLTSQDVLRILKQYSVNNLITKEDLEESLLETKLELKKLDPVWKTSGPVLTTVGFIEDNTDLPSEMTLQEVLDSIFYGSKISMQVPTNVQVGQTVEIVLCIHGGMKTDSIVLRLGNIIIEQFSDSDFDNGCVTIESNPITEDTEFTFEVTYLNGLTHIETATVRAISPMFVGILPRWKSGTDVTMEYLKDLISSDQENNEFITNYVGAQEITHSYNFRDPSLQKLLIAVPAGNPILKELVTSSLSFGVDAFEVVNLPLEIEEIGKDIPYMLYIYKQFLSSMNLDVTFKFTSKL